MFILRRKNPWYVLVMGCPAGGGACTGLVNLHWPLYTILPACTVLFYAFYIALDPISKKVRPEYADWSKLNQRIWRQNICACAHTYLLVLMLLIVVARSAAPLQAALLSPYYDPIAYSAICLSLAYMLLTLPWSLRHWFGTKQERAATRPTLIVHHCFVVIAELVYLVTQTSPWHGALSFVLFEFSNLFLMPHHLMTQVQYHGKLHFINGILFFVTCTLVRIASCTLLGVYYVVDLATWDPDPSLGAAARVCVGLSLVSFWMILLLSWYWYVNDVLGEVHREFQQSFGRDYWKRWCRCLLGNSASSATTSRGTRVVNKA